MNIYREPGALTYASPLALILYPLSPLLSPPTTIHHTNPFGTVNGRTSERASECTQMVYTPHARSHARSPPARTQSIGGVRLTTRTTDRVVAVRRLILALPCLFPFLAPASLTCLPARPSVLYVSFFSCSSLAYHLHRPLILARPARKVHAQFGLLFSYPRSLSLSLSKLKVYASLTIRSPLLLLLLLLTLPRPTAHPTHARTHARTHTRTLVHRVLPRLVTTQCTCSPCLFRFPALLSLVCFI